MKRLSHTQRKDKRQMARRKRRRDRTRFATKHPRRIDAEPVSDAFKVREQLLSREQDYIQDLASSRDLGNTAVAESSIQVMRTLRSHVEMAGESKIERLMLKITGFYAGPWCGRIVPQSSKAMSYLSGDEDKEVPA